MPKRPSKYPGKQIGGSLRLAGPQRPSSLAQSGGAIMLAGQSGSGIKSVARKTRKAFKHPRKIARKSGKVLTTAGKIGREVSPLLPTKQGAALSSVSESAILSGKTLKRAGKKKQGALGITSDVLSDIAKSSADPRVKKAAMVARAGSKLEKRLKKKKEKKPSVPEPLMKAAMETMPSNSTRLEETPGQTGGAMKKKKSKGKRKPSAYNMFVKEHRKKGMSMVDIGKKWRARK